MVKKVWASVSFKTPEWIQIEEVGFRAPSDLTAEQLKVFLRNEVKELEGADFYLSVLKPFEGRETLEQVGFEDGDPLVVNVKSITLRR